jgi:hypothetical protein
MSVTPTTDKQLDNVRHMLNKLRVGHNVSEEQMNFNEAIITFIEAVNQKYVPPKRADSV